MTWAAAEVETEARHRLLDVDAVVLADRVVVLEAGRIIDERRYRSGATDAACTE